jgi:hypothetical protein
LPADIFLLSIAMDTAEAAFLSTRRRCLYQAPSPFQQAPPPSKQALPPPKILTI